MTVTDPAFIPSHCLRQGFARACVAGLLALVLGHSVAHGGEDSAAGRYDRRLGLWITVHAVARASDGADAEDALATLSASLVREGGFHPQTLLPALGWKPGPHAAVAQTFRELEQTAAPRLGSTLRPARWCQSAVLALAYTNYPDHGARASALLTLALDADPNSADCQRVFTTLLCEILRGGFDRRAMINTAADTAQNEEIARAVRAARLLSWRKLEPADTRIGQLQRAIRVWCKRDTLEAMQDLAEQHLDDAAHACFDILGASSFGVRQLPFEQVQAAWRDQENMSRFTALTRLAGEAVLLPVPASLAAVLDPPQPRRTSTTPTITTARATPQQTSSAVPQPIPTVPPVNDAAGIPPVLLLSSGMDDTTLVRQRAIPTPQQPTAPASVAASPANEEMNETTRKLQEMTRTINHLSQTANALRDKLDQATFTNMNGMQPLAMPALNLIGDMSTTSATPQTPGAPLPMRHGWIETINAAMDSTETPPPLPPLPETTASANY